MRLGKTAWIVVSGMVWFLVGMGLLTAGLNFIVFKAQMDVADSTSLIAKCAPIAGGREQAALVLIGIGLIVGFMKGRLVLIKSVRRVVNRILSLDEPIRVSQVYSKGYLMLIAGMIALGMSMKWLGVPTEIRGMVDVAVGAALMNGALAYFRIAFAAKRQA